MPGATWPARSAGGSPAGRGSPTPATTTRWCPPTAGRWRAWSAPWPRCRWRSQAHPACRWSRSTSAAAGGRAARSAAGPHLTASRRRTTAFTEVVDRRDSDGWVEVVYWLYRPSLGWERDGRRATQADVDAAGGVRVLLRDDPALVPLETLPGRNHYDFPADERPPWQWNVPGRYPGWSS